MDEVDTKIKEENLRTEIKEDIVKWETYKEIDRLRNYLRIPTMHPDVDYGPCVAFLIGLAKEIDLPVDIYFLGPERRPTILITWVGTEPQLPSILFNSHMDVVPVYEEQWTHPPFKAEIDDKGRIFARGAQDMKSIGMQYLTAVEELKSEGFSCRRTIHISFVPDEETSGHHGMSSFVKTDEFRSLNVGFCFDEGMPSPDSTYLVFYAERCIWHIAFNIFGNSGHGSLLQEETPGEKLRHLLNKLMDMRVAEIKKLDENPRLTVGDITSINLTSIRGGVQVNVVPSSIDACFDIRPSNDVNHKNFIKQLERWCVEAGGVKMDFLLKTPFVEPMKMDFTNPYWNAFKSAIKELHVNIDERVFPAGTDGRHLREVGIPVLGFSPIVNTTVRMHDHNEYIKADEYLHGIKVYKEIMKKIGNVP